MKTILWTAVFAAGIAAQEPGAAERQDPRVELALPIAFEEQEGDLAKAEAAYRKALEGPLSPAAQWLASHRLGVVLQKLGRDEDAKVWLERAAAFSAGGMSPGGIAEQHVLGQDPAREAALREQARALVQQIASRDPGGFESTVLPGIAGQVAEQLLWIGRPAVPEIIAALDQGPPRQAAIESLFRALWRLGGEDAEAYLVAALNGRYVGSVPRTAAAAREVDLRSPAARACLRHPDPKVAIAFLQSSQPGQRGGQGIVEAVPVGDLVEVAKQGPPALQAFVLRSLRRRSMTEEELSRVHEIVQRGLIGIDADLGQAAEEFLTSSPSQGSLRGVTMLLERLPALHAKGASVESLPRLRDRVQRASPDTATTRASADPRMERQPVFPFAAAAARALVPKIDTAVAAIPRSGQRSSVWLCSCMRIVIAALGRESVPHVLRWWDGGYEAWMEFEGAEGSVLTPADVPELFARYERVPEYLRGRFLLMCQDLEVPPSMFEELCRLADAEEDADRRKALGLMMVKTGRVDVVPWLLRTWRDAEGLGDWTTKALVEIGRRDTSAAVRDAMDVVLRGDGGQAPGGRRAVELLLAFLSTGDARALDRVAAWPMTLRQRHPYATGSTELSPIQYLIYENPDPPHGFTEQQIADTVKRYLAVDEQRRQFAPRQQGVPAIGDAALAAIAEVNDQSYDGSNWRHVALWRLAQRIEQQQPSPALVRWFEAALGGVGQWPNRWFDHVPGEIVARYGERVAALLEADDESWALCALRALQQNGRPLDFEKLLHSRHELVRQRAANLLDEHPEVPVALLVECLVDESSEVRRMIADQLGARVAKDAVPVLIGLLRDPVQVVRDVAAQSLTRIRFYHEQQAHWDRVLKGLDASPATAAEKLLLQSRPDAPKAQRLLAIQSLGVLGVPEALPFLIDWSNEGDAEIAAAAKAAITRIHLDPRR
jgi:hypothetical protein